MPPEKRRALEIRLKERDAEILEAWNANLPGGNSNPKTARPYMGMREVRRIANEVGVTCATPILRRLLARIRIVTAGQSLLQKKRRILKLKAK